MESTSKRQKRDDNELSDMLASLTVEPKRTPIPRRALRFLDLMQHHDAIALMLQGLDWSAIFNLKKAYPEIAELIQKTPEFSKIDNEKYLVYKQMLESMSYRDVLELDARYPEIAQMIDEIPEFSRIREIADFRLNNLRRIMSASTLLRNARFRNNTKYTHVCQREKQPMMVAVPTDTSVVFDGIHFDVPPQHLLYPKMRGRPLRVDISKGYPCLSFVRT